jgi:hypothetical protein
VSDTDSGETLDLVLIVSSCYWTAIFTKWYFHTFAISVNHEIVSFFITYSVAW